MELIEISHPLKDHYLSILRNKETNYEYSSDKEAEDDIANPDTATQKEHVVRSVKIKVAAMPPLGTSSDKDEDKK